MTTETRQAGKRGRRPAVPLAGVGPLEYYSVGVPTRPPTQCRVPPAAGGWQMDGNDQWGDCVVAASDHAVASWNTEAHERAAGAAGPAAWARDPAGCVPLYQRLTGAQTPGDANDTGLVISDFLAGWKANGLPEMGVEPIEGFGPVDFKSLLAVQRAVAFWGYVFAGVNLPASAEQQFNAGQPWTYQGDSPIGGHAIGIVAYTPEWLVGVTWGATVLISWAWWEAYVEEAYGIVPPEFVAAGRGRFAVATDALEADVNAAIALRGA